MSATDVMNKTNMITGDKTLIPLREIISFIELPPFLIINEHIAKNGGKGPTALASS